MPPLGVRLSSFAASVDNKPTDGRAPAPQGAIFVYLTVLGRWAAFQATKTWKRERHRFAANIIGPRFEELCREWVLRFAGDGFGD